MKRLFGLYVVVEMAVIVALTVTIGFGWTVLLLAAVFLLGLALAGSQLRRHIARLQAGLGNRGAAGQAALATDSALVALGAVLMVVPGLASSLVGSLLLLPPTRAVARPMVTALAARRMALITVAAPGMTARYPGRGDYIDGEVIDVSDFAEADLDRPAVERRTDPPFA